MPIGCLRLDNLSNLPQPIIEYILTLIPLSDAVRTSTLSRKWRYYWRGMPKLVFTDDMSGVPSPSDCECEYDMPPFACVCRRQLINAILHVLFRHKGPTSVEFSCTLLGLDPDFDFIIRHLSSMAADTLKEFIFQIEDHINILPSYVLQPSFFDLQGLEYIHLEYCDFKTPSTFNGFRRLRTVVFYNVTVFSETFPLFLYKCPLLEKLSLDGFECSPSYEFEGVTESTFVDILLCVPAIKRLNISENYMTCLCIGDMPRKLPTSLLHLKQLYLHVCLTEHNEISAVLCILRSSPVLEEINFMLYDYDVSKTISPIIELLDPVNNSDLKLDHLVYWGIQIFNNLPLEVDLVKLIIARSPVLKTLQIEHNGIISDDEKLKLHTDLMLLPRASTSAELVIEMKPEVEFAPWR